MVYEAGRKPWHEKPGQIYFLQNLCVPADFTNPVGSLPASLPPATLVLPVHRAAETGEEKFGK